MEIHTLDLDFQGVSCSIAAYLIIGPAGPILIETGPASTLERLQERLAEHDVAASDIRDVLVTHIHLDHAGAAGWWSRQGARVHVHHVGAPHLIDPSKLLSSASRIYGDRMGILWGETVAADAARVRTVHDGDVIEAGGLSILALDTPGHATHHLAFRIGDIGFTGDAGGIHIPGCSMVDLPAPPPEFDPESWDVTIDRLLEQRFARIYPTHFGPLDDVADRLEKLRALMHDATELVGSLVNEGLDRRAILPQYNEWNQRRAESAGLDEEMVERVMTANPPDMSVDGILRYLRKRSERAASMGD